MTVKLGINGFGRIGRNVLRAATMARQTDIEFVGVIHIDCEDRVGRRTIGAGGSDRDIVRRGCFPVE